MDQDFLESLRIQHEQNLIAIQSMARQFSSAMQQIINKPPVPTVAEAYRDPVSGEVIGKIL